MIIQKSKDKPLQFDANLEKIIFRTFEKRSKNRSCERTVLYIWLVKNIILNFKTKLTKKDQIARINITLPTKTRPIYNHEFLIKI